jgi:hypothetical protein
MENLSTWRLGATSGMSRAANWRWNTMWYHVAMHGILAWRSQEATHCTEQSGQRVTRIQGHILAERGWIDTCLQRVVVFKHWSVQVHVKDKDASSSYKISEECRCSQEGTAAVGSWAADWVKLSALLRILSESVVKTCYGRVHVSSCSFIHWREMYMKRSLTSLLLAVRWIDL